MRVSVEGKVRSRNLLDFCASAIAKDAREAWAIFLLLRRRTILELSDAKERRGDQDGWKETICCGRVSTRGGHLRWNRRWFHISFFLNSILRICQAGVKHIWMSCPCLVHVVFSTTSWWTPPSASTQHRAKPLSVVSNEFPRSRNLRKGNQLECQATMVSRHIRNGYIIIQPATTCPWRILKIMNITIISILMSVCRNTQDLIFGIEQHVTEIDWAWHSWFKLLQLVEGNLLSPPRGMKDVSIKEVDFGSAVSCLVRFCGQRISKGWRLQCFWPWKIGTFCKHDVELTWQSKPWTTWNYG